MQSSVLCSVRVNMMERRPLVAIGRKATDRIRDSRMHDIILLNASKLLFESNAISILCMYVLYMWKN